MPYATQSHAMHETLIRLAPGTALREGIDLILKGRTGGLIVIGHDHVVDSLCHGGFQLDVEFSPARLRELSKMDGAVLLSDDGDKIVRANVHLTADPAIPSEETGTRHRTAERAGLQTGRTVVSISKATGVVTVYRQGMRHVLPDPSTQWHRADSALSTLELLWTRISSALTSLAWSETNQVATLGQVTAVIHRMQQARAMTSEIDCEIRELGTAGRILATRLTELSGDLDRQHELLILDYRTEGATLSVSDTIGALDTLDQADSTAIGAVLGYSGVPASTRVVPLGLRLLDGLPGLSEQLSHRLIKRFGSLSGLLCATEDELRSVDGVEVHHAWLIRAQAGKDELPTGQNPRERSQRTQSSAQHNPSARAKPSACAPFS